MTAPVLTAVTTTSHHKVIETVSQIAPIIGQYTVLSEYLPDGKNIGRYCVLKSNQTQQVLLLCDITLNGSAVYKTLSQRLKQNGLIVIEYQASLSVLRDVLDDSADKNDESTSNNVRVDKSANVHLFEEVVRKAVDLGASDIHFEIRDTSTNTCEIKVRIDGIIQPLQTPIKASLGEHLIAAAYQSSVASGGTAEAWHRKTPIDFAYELHHNGRVVRLRIATMPASDLKDDDGIDIVARIFNADGAVASLDQLGYLPSQLRILDLCAKTPQGLFLMIGGTGSGKSTTLRAMITRDEHRSLRKQYSIEQPVEIKIQGITQVNASSIKPKGVADSDVMSYLVRGLMRLDPDDIMVGEVRDEATGAAVQSAIESGHRGFSTLHARDPIQAFLRMLSPAIGMSREVITSPGFITAIVAQKLVTKLCTKCKVPETRDEVLAELGTLGIGLNTIYRKKEGGCEHCRNLGLKGRQACASILVPDLPFLSHINEGNIIAAIKHWRNLRKGALDADNYEGKSIYENALYAVSKGWLGFDEVVSELGPIEMAILQKEITVLGAGE